jgi:CheY-like chemotaxis protein
MPRLAFIIDDDKSSRVMYETLLRGFKFDIKQFADGIEALDALRNTQPDVIFLDLLMPQMNGMEVLDFIYQSPHLTHTRVFVITAHLNLRDDVKLRHGDEYYIKPVPFGDLREILTAVIEQMPG